MTLNALVGALFVAGSLVSFTAHAADDKASEPEQKAMLVIDGKSHAIAPGKKTKMKIGGQDRTVSLEMSPFRDFDKAGVRFQYVGQRHFSYEKLSAQVDHWSLDGNNTIIMVQHYSVPVTREDILSEFQKQFKAMNASIKQSGVSMKLKGGKLSGDRLDITLGNVKLSQDIYVIASDKSTRTFILQDTISDKGKNTDEYFQTRKRIEKSLSL